ncbi:MAG TPA: hypothetical protein VI389_09195 [Geobacteraceae bacterium]
MRVSQLTRSCIGWAVVLLTACSSGKEEKKEKAAVDVATVAGATPIEMEYVPEGFPLGLSVGQGFAFNLSESPGDKQRFRKMPPEAGFKRYYDELTLAGKPHLVITEESKPPRLYFDENRNGDLTDDRGPFPAEKEGLFPNHYSIQIRYEPEKVVAPYRMWLFSSNMGGIRFYPVCHWRGTLALEGRSYAMVAFDSNADGDYSNDPLVIDVDGNGKAGDDERLMPGQSVAVEGKVVTLAGISPSGLTVRLRW